MQQTLRDIFWESASHHTRRIALMEEGRRYSYQEIAEQVAGVASLLVEVGVTPGTRVAVCAQPSARSIVGMLAVLCAGGVYVPIDPETPLNRTSEMLANAQTSFVLGDKSLASQEAFRGLLILDPVNDSFPTSTLPGALVEPSNLACVFYTSGSSGRPKGVAIEHNSVVNYIRSLGAVYGISPGDKVMPFFSIAFDWSMEEQLLPLSLGATVVTPRDRRYQTPMELAMAVRDNSISIIGMPPSYLDQLTTFLQEDDPNLVASLRLLITGGEQLTPQAWTRWDSLGLNIPIMNTYGPTEATIVTTYHELRPGDEYSDGVPIGRPINKASVYVLDESLSPVPDGEEGEIVIGGEGVARGYLGDPVATAERFVADPFTSTPGGRMYRTGDRGALQPSDNNLRFYGRLDNQIKLHGYRIELEEIEATLCTHPAISEAVVILSPEEPRRLVAYVALRREDVPKRQLRTFLSSRLPHYMVPSYFVGLDPLPRGINGKVDKDRLPRHSTRAGARSTPFEPPHTRQEQALADVFATVLDLDEVGREDNFFELGGDSIQSIQVVSRAGRFGLILSPRDVYEHQTVAAIAAHATSAGVREERPPHVEPSSIPLTPSQAWFFEESFEEPSRWTNDTRFWTAADENLTREAIDRLTERHEALRVRFKRMGDDWVQYLPSQLQGPSLSVVDIADLGVAQDEGAIDEAIGRLHASIDIVNGPLWSVGLFRTDVGNLVVIAGHHLVMDGVSFLLLEEEFDQLVNAAQADWPMILPPALPISEWTRRLQAHAHSPELLQEYSYWYQLMASDMEPLPTDGPRDCKSASSVEFVAVRIGEEDAALYRDVVRPSGIRSDALLLAALAISFEQWRAGPLRVFVEAHCRGEVFSDMDVSRTVGWIQCYFPIVLRAEISDPWSTLRDINDLLEETPNGGLGFGVLRHLGPEEASKTLASLYSLDPLGDIAFNFQGYLPSGSVARSDEPPDTPFVEYGTVHEGGAPEMRGKNPPLMLIHPRATDRSLATEFVYNGQVFSRATMRHVARSYLAALENLLRSVPRHDALL